MSGLLGWAKGRVRPVWTIGRQTGVSATFAAQLGAALFVIGGGLNLFTAFQPSVPGADTDLLVVAGLGVAVAGVAIWFLPWARWSARATLWLVPFALLCVALSNMAGGRDPWEWDLYFLVVFVWIGICQRPGVSLCSLPLFAAAYVLPLFPTHQTSTMALTSVVYVGIVCAVVGESVAWVRGTGSRPSPSSARSWATCRAWPTTAPTTVCGRCSS